MALNVSFMGSQLLGDLGMDIWKFLILSQPQEMADDGPFSANEGPVCWAVLEPEI